MSEDTTLNSAIENLQVEIELRKEIERLRTAMRLAEHKIDQTISGQYLKGDALSVALWALRDALKVSA